MKTKLLANMHKQKTKKKNKKQQYLNTRLLQIMQRKIKCRKQVINYTEVRTDVL